MITGVGIDLEEVGRIRGAIERHGERFLQRIFTAAEIAYVEGTANRYERYTARFAAKEAGMKALGTGMLQGVGFRDFEVTNLAGGRPVLGLSGKAAEVAARQGVRTAQVSLTHTATHGMAVVILEA